MKKYWLVLFLLTVTLISSLVYLLYFSKEREEETPPRASERVMISGEFTCLPHQDKNGPQTLECALGLKGNDGVYYGLRDPEMKYLIGLPTGQKLKVEGTLNYDNKSKYDIVGNVDIESLEKE